MTLLFLYNAEVRYAVQLRHMSIKIQRGYLTRKSCIHENISCCFFKKISVRDKWNFRVGCIEQVHCGYMLYGSDFLVRRKIEECQELTYILSCIIYIEKKCFSYINRCLK